ncbi:MAG: DNA translocase FtsK 4TM domain-containing protein, partial [Rhodospirillales bacterium]|nr:DNA translocase FtsK 4TM domain-containing protein [Rhodospirillales bacterium]
MAAATPTSRAAPARAAARVSQGRAPQARAALPASRRAPAGRLASPELRSLMQRRLEELGAVALALLGGALLVALASYHSADPSLDTATAGGAANWLGRPGALVADLLLQGFGIAALLPVLALLAWAWRIGAHRGLGSASLRAAALLAGTPALAAVLAGLPGPHGQVIAWPVAGGLGGAAGRVLGGALLGAGHAMLGRGGAVGMWVLAAALAAMLVPLALGLSRAEWRAAGRAARVSVGHGRNAAG